MICNLVCLGNFCARRLSKTFKRETRHVRFALLSVWVCLKVPNKSSSITISSVVCQSVSPNLAGVRIASWPLSCHWTVLKLKARWPVREAHLYCTLYTLHYTLYTVHCILYTVHCKVMTVHCVQRAVYCGNLAIQWFKGRSL